MRGERGLIEEAGDGFTSEGGPFDLLKDDAGARGAAKGNEDDVAGGEGEVGGVGETAGARAEDFGGDDLVKH